MSGSSPSPLLACPIMTGVVARTGDFPFRAGGNGLEPFEALARAIVFQQLSGKAAQTILDRTLALFGGDAFPAPDAWLDKSEAELRSAGLSRNKVAALHDLAAKTRKGVVPGRKTAEALDDDALIARLVAVRGVGRWTAQMFLLSGLGRPDVWPVDDLGVRQGWRLAYALDEAPSPKALDALGERFRPARSEVAWRMWRLVDLSRAETS